jgi:pimeloyl-ACP methyl ester carboxylesterase
MTTTEQQTSLAYERHGAGVPVVLLHGLTFDRRSWRPVIDRLGAGVESIAIDLPGHGESAGPPRPLEEVAAQVHALVARLGVERPVVVGHSISGGLAMVYGAAYPVRGVVVVDALPELRSFAQLLQRLEPVLRGPGFAAAFEPFRASMGVELIPAPERAEVTQDLGQELVLGYWEELLRSDPDELQAWVDGVGRANDAPVLGVFGRSLAPADRDHMSALVPHFEIEEWPGAGHCVHLSRADRFAAALRAFVGRCA